MVFEMGGKWPFSGCFVGCCFQVLFKTTRSILVLFSSRFFCECFDAFARLISTSLSVDEILLPRYMYLSTNLNVDGSFSFKKHVLFYLPSCKRQYLLLPAPGNAAGIRLEQVYLQEMLYHFHGLRLV